MNSSTTHGSIPALSVRQPFSGDTCNLAAIKASKGVWFMLKHSTLGAFVISRWLLTQKLGLRVLTVLLALCIYWIVGHPQTDRVIVHDVIAGSQVEAHAAAAETVRVITRVVVGPSASLRLSDAVHRPAISPNLDGYLLHAPSISSGTIQRALEAMGSPMAMATATDSHGLTKNMSQWIYDEGRALGVDPALLLAVCKHESSCGREGVARCSKSLSNQRPTTFNTPQCPGSDGWYQAFPDWGHGVDGMYQLLWRYGHGFGFPVMKTWRDAVGTWAPPSDFNDDAAYAADVYNTIFRWEGR